MATLTPDEIRVLGVLVEKALTTPAQYPLTLNAVVVGCSQKNNRSPVVEYQEDRVYDAIDGLKAKGIVREAMLSGSRVAKFRQVALESLKVTMPELVVLTELMLRGPQTVGEIRGNASRMHPIESLEACQSTLEGLVRRTTEAGGFLPGPLVAEVAPPPGSRARQYAQLLSPGAHPVGAASSVSVGAPAAISATAHTAAPASERADVSALAARVAALEARLESLERKIAGE